MNVAQTVGRTLVESGIRQVFGVVGSGNFAVSNAMVAAGARFVTTRHEAGATTMADGYARLSGEVAAVTVHQGCGFTNTLTGLTEAAKSRTPLLLLEEDTSPGRHDMLFACCDKWLYKHYGCPPGHRNCRDNFLEALFEAGFDATLVPNPLNLWMNIPVSNDRDLAIGTPLSKPGDQIVLTALIDLVVVLSACPMDITPINGEDRTPKSVFFRVD